MIAWFGYSVWQLRDVWAEVYALHDSKRSDAERIESAIKLSRDPRVTDHQLMEICLRRDLPDRARYLLAEAVSTEAVARDPRAYALTVALSQDWPDWLRLVLARRLAYGATRGYAIPEVGAGRTGEALGPDDPSLGGLLAGRAARLENRRGRQARRSSAHHGRQRQARRDALATRGTAPPKSAERRLDEATIWLRHHHPQAARSGAVAAERVCWFSKSRDAGSPLISQQRQPRPVEGGFRWRCWMMARG